MEVVLPAFAPTGPPEATLPASEARREVLPRERAVLAVIVTWIAVGLAIDTRRHRTDRSLDTFFTSAHGVLYAGWIAAAVFLLYVVRARQSKGAKRWAAVPRGFEAAVVGAALFGLGGVGDMIWHTEFGIEQDLKILFSPTHLFLMSAMVMISFGVVRSTWLSTEPSTMKNLWPAVLSSGVIGSVWLVFFQYVSAFDRGIFTTVVPDLLGLSEIIRVQSIAGVVIMTVVFFAPMLLLARRWVLPIGTATLAFSIPAASNFIFTDFKAVRLSAAVLAGGVIVDLVWIGLARLRRTQPRLAFRLFGAGGPITFWCAYLAISMPGHRMQWPAELWTGTLIWSALIGTGITVLLLPPSDTPASWLDDRSS